MSYRLEDYHPPWHVRIQDILWRRGLLIAFKLLEGYCFLFHPVVRGVYVAVWYDKNLLLVENSYRSKFYFPSGGVRVNERPLEAAQRELSEEVGLQVSLDKFAIAFEMQVDHDNMRDRVTTFEVHLDAHPSLAIDRREVIAARFVPVADALELDLATVVREYVRRKAGNSSTVA